MCQRAKTILFALLLACLFSGCSTVTLSQEIRGRYLCKETGDRMVFTPSGKFEYSLGGAEGAMYPGFYCYDGPLVLRPDALAELPEEPSNEKGHGLRLGTYLSQHCSLWGSPYFSDREKRTLIIRCKRLFTSRADWLAIYWPNRILHFHREPEWRLRTDGHH
jgi:hypothetical protein